jgi:hypothetical protein
MGLSESDISAAKETGSIELCTKSLSLVAEALGKQSEALKVRLGPITRELNPEIEDDRKLAPMTIASHTVNGKCGLAVELAQVIQKLRMIEIETEAILRNLDL